jgi:hypothetical protein
MLKEEYGQAVLYMPSMEKINSRPIMVSVHAHYTPASISTPRPPLCHCLGGTNVFLSCVLNVPYQLHVSTLAYILSVFQECDITEVT